MTFFIFVLKCVYFMLPAYFANMAPVFFRKIKFLDIPIDVNKKFLGKPIFGKNKTYRGLFFGILLGFLVFLLQKSLSEQLNAISLIDYSSVPLILGILLSAGAIVGDLIKSFIKRRIRIKEGQPFIPFDQLDFALGALLFSFAYIPNWQSAVVILAVSPILHIIVNHLAFYLKIRKEKW
ncbi:MAG TPA: CDP-2,3-bis-(O-geranylgeranyl)-sn-glycerol synthase [Candidatus Nanoarchaeia archaeon]|nr:CDP-2,3-bis-(O-geranylgeranyl)-sn-glycerol synthase [Candidatus Nanoarchaeia archaeon]